MRRSTLTATLLCTLALPVAAQSALPKAVLDDTEALGTIATLAPLCALRDDGWAEDLRRATIQSATGTQAHDDTSLHDAPGSNVVASVLGDAEHEALETFTEEPGGKTCAKVAKDANLARADNMVRAFRGGRITPAS